MASSNSTINIVIADDHPLMREALAGVCAQLDAAKVVAKASDGLEAIALTKQHHPDLLLLDSGMPLATGMQVYAEIQRWSKDAKVVVITGFTSAGHLADWAEAGVQGLFLKSCPMDEVLLGLQQVIAGEVYRSAAVTELLSTQPETRVKLTNRERQILHLLADGSSNKEIAQKLSISVKTVDTHRTKIMSKLDVHSVAQLIAYALKEGLLEHKTQS